MTNGVQRLEREHLQPVQNEIVQKKPWKEIGLTQLSQHTINLAKMESGEKKVRDGASAARAVEGNTLVVGHRYRQ